MGFPSLSQTQKKGLKTRTTASACQGHTGFQQKIEPQATSWMAKACSTGNRGGAPGDVNSAKTLQKLVMHVHTPRRNAHVPVASDTDHLRKQKKTREIKKMKDEENQTHQQYSESLHKVWSSTKFTDIGYVAAFCCLVFWRFFLFLVVFFVFSRLFWFSEMVGVRCDRNMCTPPRRQRVHMQTTLAFAWELCGRPRLVKTL